MIGRLKLSAVTGRLEGEAIDQDLQQALTTPADKRTAKQRQAIAAAREAEDPQFARLQKQKARLTAELAKLPAPTTQVMREMATPRPSTMFNRGVYTNPGEPVTPAVPRPLAGTSTPPGSTRLELARWLASAKNPLVARVTVNRWWSELFGQGLVTTPEDFGLKGERPTHPDLLDWLAVDFHENGGSLKKFLRTVVLSSTYRQSSAATPELLERDDRNLLYARGSRFRMDAEMIRDNALAIAGLISLKQGGPPIRPYQPEGLWVKVGGQRYDYEVSPGEDRYRRGLYVVCKRGSPYPSFVNFDANNRMSCRVKRPRSNTPTQALTLLNDPVYVEAAKAFASRVLTTPAADDDSRLATAFQIATARRPTEREAALLRTLLAAQRADGLEQAADVQKLVADFPLPAAVAPAEFAAWYAVCAALLNLDETMTRG